MAMLEIRDLNVYYGGIHALKGISFEPPLTFDVTHRVVFPAEMHFHWNAYCIFTANVKCYERKICGKQEDPAGDGAGDDAPLALPHQVVL